MFRKSITLASFVALVPLIACVVGVFLVKRASPQSSSPTQLVLPAPRNPRAARNMSLQPEALRVARRLGKRFESSSRAVATIAADLTIGDSRLSGTLVRRQTERGEDVDLLLDTRKLTWTDSQETTATSDVVTPSERLLMERLVLDSPDQFVLAQLRGASYWVVAQNVRPPDATDGYTGPLWNLVRVDEPRNEADRRSSSSWRIYYINTQSGLPDRVEYQLNGQMVRAEFMEWSEVQGEKVPSKIRWLKDGQVIMEGRFTNASTADSATN